MARGVLREHRRSARPRAGAHLQGSLGQHPLTFLFLVCTLCGWLGGTLAGWLQWGDPGGGCVGGILGLSLGVGLTVWLERRGGSTVAHDSALANFGLVWVAWSVGLLGVVWLSTGTDAFAGEAYRPGWSLTSLREACLIMPPLFALAAAWQVKVRSRGGALTYVAVLVLWTALALAEAAWAAHQVDAPLAPLWQTAGWSLLLGCVPAFTKSLRRK